MKKNLTLLTIVILTLCLVSFVFDRIIPASPVHAESETYQAVIRAESPEKETAAQPQLAQPAVFIITGLVIALFGVLAVSPLLVDDPVRLLQEANHRNEG